MTRLVYVDNGATTAVSKNVYNSIIPYLITDFGNPSSLHSKGRTVRIDISKQRDIVANAINADAHEILFTSGGTEADNLAIKGVMFSKKARGNHLITTQIEHPAVLDTAKDLEKSGFIVTYLPVDSNGKISLDELRAVITDKTALVSIMSANNEIGTIQPIQEIGKICRENGVLFHTDAVQGIGHMHIDVKSMNIDLLSLSAHKIHGVKGVGALYCKRGILLAPIINGGGQERNKRSGTENVIGIVSLGTAIKDATTNLDEHIAHLAKLRDKLIKGVLETIPYSFVTGHPTDRLPQTASFTFQAIEGEALVLMLDKVGICASTGSACSTGSLDPSHVLMAIGLPHETAHGSLRITFSTMNTEDDVEYILQKLPPIVARLREMSPLWEE